MVCVHKNFNGSLKLITPLSGMICHPWASTCYDQPPIYQFEVYISTHYEDMKGDTKYKKWGVLE